MATNNKRKTNVAIHTLGCKLNQAESDYLAADLVNKGYNLVRSVDNFDVFILNTCTVTHIADRKARRLLRLARRQNPEDLIIATGCYAERAPEEIKKTCGIDIVLGNTDKEALPDLIENMLDITFLPEEITPITSTKLDWRTRAMVKIQDGCNQSCAYCIVPLVRNKIASRDHEDILKQISLLSDQGYKEIVLTGSNIGSYKYNGLNLIGLLQTILEKTSINRLRLTSLQPQEISLELISLWQNHRLCRHIHIPLQSGNDDILRRMKRNYNSNAFLKAVRLVRHAVPDIAITTDVMVGFPGETDKEFRDTELMCEEVGFSRMHIFPYSTRPGTEAASMPQQIKATTKKERIATLKNINEQNTYQFKKGFLGHTIPVLWENRIKEQSNIWSGLTDTYIRVFTRSIKPLKNKILPTRMAKLEGEEMWGEIDID